MTFSRKALGAAQFRIRTLTAQPQSANETSLRSSINGGAKPQRCKTTLQSRHNGSKMLRNLFTSFVKRQVRPNSREGPKLTNRKRSLADPNWANIEMASRHLSDHDHPINVPTCAAARQSANLHLRKTGTTTSYPNIGCAPCLSAIFCC